MHELSLSSCIERSSGIHASETEDVCEVQVNYFLWSLTNTYTWLVLTAFCPNPKIFTSLILLPNKGWLHIMMMSVMHALLLGTISC